MNPRGLFVGFHLCFLWKKTIKHLCIWLVDNLDMSVLTWSFTMGRGPGGLPSDDLSRFGFGGCIGNRCAVWKPQSDGLGASAVDALPRLLRVILIWDFLIATNGVSYISLLPDCGNVSKSLKWMDFWQCVHCVVLFLFFGWRWFRMLSFVSGFCCRDDFAIFGVWSHTPFPSRKIGPDMGV